VRASSGNSERHSERIICVRKTLHVLVFRLVPVALVESVPTALRTYVFFGHNTNRVDLELWGAALPASGRPGDRLV